MQVKKIMTKNPACCTPDTSLQEVAQMMEDYDCGCIPVVENFKNMKPVGTITDRDITIRTFAAKQNPLEMKASDIMTADIVTITPDASVEECCDVMEDNEIRRVLVVDKNGKCCGIVAQADVAQIESNPHRTANLVREISDSPGSQTGGTSSHDISRRSLSKKESLLNTKSILTILGGVGLGAAFKYYFGAEQEQKKRALATAPVKNQSSEKQSSIGQTPLDLSIPNKVSGTKSTITGTVESSDKINDSTINTEIGKTANPR